MILPGDGGNNGGSFWLSATSLAMVTNTGTIRCRAGRRASGGDVRIQGGIVNNGLAGQPGTIRAGDKLGAGDFQQIADKIPGVSDLLGAAPAPSAAASAGGGMMGADDMMGFGWAHENGNFGMIFNFTTR